MSIGQIKAQFLYGQESWLSVDKGFSEGVARGTTLMLRLEPRQGKLLIPFTF